MILGILFVIALFLSIAVDIYESQHETDEEKQTKVRKYEHYCQ